jgi:hypothetical protein
MKKKEAQCNTGYVIFAVLALLMFQSCGRAPARGGMTNVRKET